MLLLILGLVIFFGIHLLPTAPELRRDLAVRFGDNAYKVVFSIISLAGFALIVLGYHKLQLNPGKNVVLFDAPGWTRHITYLLMLPAMIFLVASQVPSRIRTALKHPMLVAAKTWALAHLITNGDLASLLLFGSFLAYAVYDRISVKKRGALGPLGDRQGAPVNDVFVIAGGLALYAFFVTMGHGWLIGVPLLQ